MLTNAGANLLGFGATVVAAFFVSPILVHGLGNQRYGVWSLVDSVLAYLSILDLGIGAAVVRYVAKHHENDEPTELNRILSTSVFVFALAGFAAFLVTMGLTFLAPRPFGVPAELVGDTRWLLCALGLNLAIGLPLSAYSAALDGLGQYPLKNAVRCAMLVLRSACFVYVVSVDGGLKGIATVALTCGVIDGLTMAILTRRLLPALNCSPQHVNLATLRQIGGYSSQAFLAMLAGRMSYQTDAIVIGAFLAPEMIAFFAIAARLVGYAKDGMRSMTTVLTPQISVFDARGDVQAIQRVLVTGARWCLYLILPVQLGLLFLGRSFLANWMGTSYAERCFPTLCILSIPLSLVISQSVSGRILYGVGELRWFAKLTVVEGVANVLLSILLVRHWGIEGVAIGTVIPSVIFNLALCLLACRVTRTSLGEYLQGAIVLPLLVAMIPASIWSLCAYFGEATVGWIGFIVTGACGVVPYAMAVLLIEIGPGALQRRLMHILQARPGDSRS